MLLTELMAMYSSVDRTALLSQVGLRQLLGSQAGGQAALHLVTPDWILQRVTGE